MAIISKTQRDKLKKYKLDLPTDKRTKAYKQIVKKLEKTDNQYKAYVKKTIKDYEKSFNKYIGTIKLKYLVVSNEKSYMTEFSVPFDKIVSESKLEQEKNEVVTEFIRDLTSSYADITDVRIQERIDLVVQQNTKPLRLKDIPMRDAGVSIIDGYNRQEWDTKTGRCVFDFIIHKYGKVKCFIGKCKNYDTLNELFQYIIPDWKREGVDFLKDGVTTDQLKSFCKHFNLPMYAIDDDKKCFDYYKPEKPNTKISGIVFRLCNDHFYPIESRSEIQKVVQTVAMLNNVSSDIMTHEKPVKLEEEETPVQESKVEYVDNVEEKLCEFLQNGEQPDKFKYLKTKFYSFTHKGITYVDNKNVDVIKTFCKNMGIESKGQGLGTIIFDIYSEVSGNQKMPKSVNNPEVLKTLREAKRNRNHYGYINEVDMDTSKYIAYDLIKCYRSAMYNPIEEWITFDFNDVWEEYDDNYELKIGLYYIKTEDTTLFKKSNVYSRASLLYARECGMHFEIIYQLIPKKRSQLLDKDFFRPLIDKIIELLNGDDKIAKLPINMISGMLGKSETEASIVHLNKSTEQIMTWLHDNQHLGKAVILNPLPVEGNKCLYGIKKQFKPLETNIPMYIQILDMCNIMLHKMCNNIQGELVARKSDCAVFTNVQGKVKTGNKWGEFRKCDVPVIQMVEQCDEYIMNIEDNWDEHYIEDSDDWAKIKKVLDEEGGLLLQGNAGNGKTWVAMNIIKEYAKRVKVLAPTNKAALNIRGNTIHSFLKMTEEGKISKKFLDIIRDSYDLIVVDEISMIDKEMWRRLCLLKQQTKIKFLLLGDDKQCPPVEVDGLESYFNHPAVRYLTNNQRNTLTVRKRYDKELYDMLKNVDKVDVKKFIYKDTEVNICYTNDTRVYINKMWNDKLKTEDAILISANPDDYESQDIYLYEGLPVIATRTKRDKQEGILWANSEKYWVSGYDDKNIVLWTERPNENGEKEDYVIDVEIDEFRNNFYMNYCCTTHKMQGETLTDNFTIYDWDKMTTKLRYTALSRAKKPDQVYISNLVVPRRPNTFISNINKKLKSYKEQDKVRGFKTNIKVADVTELYKVQNGDCKICGCVMKQTYSGNDRKQFSVDRVDSRCGHVKGNIQLLCLECNRSKKNRF